MAAEEALVFLRSCWSSVFGQSDLKDSITRDPESVSKRRAKGPSGPSPWTAVTAAVTYVGAVMELLGHLLMIVGICWASWKFSTSHDKIVDPFKRCRYFATLSLLPVVLYTTGKHWSQGTHFPLTASRSFQVLVRDWWTVECPEELKGLDLLQWLGNGIFFCYIGSWNFLLLFQRRGDPEVFDFAARLLVPLLIFSCCLRAPQMLLAFSFFGLVALALLLLLSTAGMVMLILLLAWLVVAFEGRASEIKISFTMTRAHDVVSFFYRNM